MMATKKKHLTKRQRKGQTGPAPEPKEGLTIRVMWTVMGVAGVPFALMGLLLALFGWETYARGRESLDWPSIDATVHDVEIEGRVETTTSGSGSRYRADEYHVYINYEYEVDGQSYRRQWLEGIYGDEDRARAAAVTFPAGEPFREIYYDPEDPGREIVERGGSLITVVFIDLGAIALFTTGVMMFLMAFFSKGKPEGWLGKRCGIAALSLAGLELLGVLLHHLIA